MITLSYSSNNSGGGWWLKDKDWKALEKAGWEVEWGGLWFCKVYNFSHKEKPDYLTEECVDKCPGHRLFFSPKEMKEKDKWLGSLARACKKDFPSLYEGLKEFEKITNQTITDEGCNCCGAPHAFSWEGDKKGYASGEELLAYLYPDKKIPSSIRETLENN